MTTKFTITNSTHNGYVLSDGSFISKNTIIGKLHPDLMVPGSDNELRIGADVPIYRSKTGQVYLDINLCYESQTSKPYVKPLIESESMELKQSLFTASEKDAEEDSYPKQFKVLARTIFSFVNARIPKWELKVGYYDNGYPKGLDSEVPNEQSQRNFEIDFKNYITQICGNRIFAISIIFKWEIVHGKKILTITAPHWDGDILLLSGSQLYVRDSASTVLLKWQDAVDYIRNFK